MVRGLFVRGQWNNGPQKPASEEHARVKKGTHTRRGWKARAKAFEWRSSWPEEELSDEDWIDPSEWIDPWELQEKARKRCEEIMMADQAAAAAAAACSAAASACSNDVAMPSGWAAASSEEPASEEPVSEEPASLRSCLKSAQSSSSKVKRAVGSVHFDRYLYAQNNKHEEVIFAQLRTTSREEKTQYELDQWKKKKNLAAKRFALARSEEEEDELMKQDQSPLLRRARQKKWIIQQPTWTERGWGFRWVWVDAKPASSGWSNPHDGYWTWEEVWYRSIKLDLIHHVCKWRERYDGKLDACRKWWLRKVLSEWSCTCQMEKAIHRQQQEAWERHCLEVERSSTRRRKVWEILIQVRMLTLKMSFHCWRRQVHAKTCEAIVDELEIFCQPASMRASMRVFFEQ